MTITANNQGFVLPEGTRLALIDSSGNIIDNRPELAAELFNSAGDPYVAALDKYLSDSGRVIVRNSLSEARKPKPMKR